jgi:hypothetical protein
MPVFQKITDLKGALSSVLFEQTLCRNFAVLLYLYTIV